VIVTGHKDLVREADKWLKANGWKIVIRDCFRAYTDTGEQPDVIAWRNGVSLLVECKASRSDFLADKSKAFRAHGGMGDWRFIFCPPGVVDVADLVPGWGLLHSTERGVRKVHGYPTNMGWHSDKPFDGNKACENQMLVSALRRFAVRGQFDTIYEKLA
jgi:hypothetical protein